MDAICLRPIDNLTDDRARLLCSLGSIPHCLTVLARTLDMSTAEIAACIASARDDGWPILGNRVRGFTLCFSDTEDHQRMAGELEAWGNQLYAT